MDKDQVDPACGAHWDEIDAEEKRAAEERAKQRFHPYSMPRPLGRTKLTAEATQQEVEIAQRSLYGWWWRFLKASPEYGSADPKIAGVRADFGELGDNFADWWRSTGRQLFAEKIGRAVTLLVDERGADHDDMPRRAVVEIYMHIPRKEILKELNEVLDYMHPGDELRPERYSQAKRSIFENAKYRLDAFPKMLEVWRVKQQHPDWKWWQVGEAAKISPGLIVQQGDDKSLVAEKHRDLNKQTRDLYEKAERLLHHAVRGHFPRDEEPDEK